MPTFKIETPSGSTVDVEADDADAAIMEAHKLTQPAKEQQDNWKPLTEDGAEVRIPLTPHMTPEDMQWAMPDKVQQSLVTAPVGRGGGAIRGGTAAEDEAALQDTWKSMPHYGVTAVSSFFGMPGDIIKMGRLLANKAGMETSKQPVLGSEEISSAIEGVTGELHKPTTRLGKTVDTAAMIAPAVFGGPGSFLFKAGTRVAAPAVASEIAGTLTEGTSAEPWARAAALIVTPFAVSKSLEPLAKSFVRKKTVLDTAEIKKLEKAEYNAADLTGTMINTQQAFSPWLQKVLTGFHSTNSNIASANPGVTHILQEMVRTAQSGAPLKLSELQSWRKRAGKLMNVKNDDGSAEKLYAEIQQFADDLKVNPNMLTGPNRDKAIEAWRNADELHKRRKNSELLDTIYTRAANKLGQVKYNLSGEGEALRAKFQQLADRLADVNSKEYRFFTPEMRDAINKAARGDWKLKTMRILGSFAPLGMMRMGAVAGMPMAAAAFLGFSNFIGVVWAATLAAGGIAGKVGAHLLTKGYADDAADLIRSGKKLPKSTPGASPGVPIFGVPHIMTEDDNANQ